MFYRLDGSNYLFVDWDRLDATCKSPEDKDARGRRCGQRATSYKGAKKSVGNLGQKQLSNANQARLSELRSKIQQKGNMGKVSGKDRLRATQGLITERNQTSGSQYRAAQEEAYKQRLARKQSGKERRAQGQARLAKAKASPDLDFGELAKSSPGKYAKEEAREERAFRKLSRDLDKATTTKPRTKKRSR